MFAQIINEFGSPEVFNLVEMEIPEPKPGQILVRQHASSVNPVDYKIRSGEVPIGPELPAKIGSDVAGVVTALGQGVSDFAIGDEVYGAAAGVGGQDGAYGEFVTVEARLMAKKPKALSLQEAGVIPLVGITALEGIKRAGLKEGQTLLVRGGTGGVGHMVIQLAKAYGARVVATVSSPEKEKIVRELGADDIINYRTQDVQEAVQELTDGKGFDVVFNATGGKEMETDFQAAKLNGQVVSIVSLFEADLSSLHTKGLSLHLVFMLLPMLAGIGETQHKEALQEIATFIDQGKVKPLIDPERFSLKDLSGAHAKAESGKSIGKILIHIP